MNKEKLPHFTCFDILTLTDTGCWEMWWI